MDSINTCPMAVELAAHIRDARHDLTTRWLDRIAARVRVDPDRLIPSDELRDRIPVLILGIADYVEDPCEEITADVPVIARAMELGELRFRQGFDASEILKEYEILGGVLFTFASNVVAASASPCTLEEMVECSHRLFRAISVIEQVTTAQYLRALGERVGEREERLRRFNRMITHELKNRVGATLGAGQLLQEEWLGDAERRRFAGMVTDNAHAIQKVLENLIALSRLDTERRRQRNIALREVVREVFRQLRELARARGVDLRMHDDLPDVEVNAAAIELCLSNYLSNAIKYTDMSQQQRFAEVTARIETLAERGDVTDCELVVRVRDNGLGVPLEKRAHLFERFFRAHEDVGVDGTGLGLSLVQETTASLGGRVWAEFEGDSGAVFAFALPCRRAGELTSCVGRAPAREEPLRPKGEAPMTASD